MTEKNPSPTKKNIKESGAAAKEKPAKQLPAEQPLDRAHRGRKKRGSGKKSTYQVIIVVVVALMLLGAAGLMYFLRDTQAQPTQIAEEFMQEIASGDINSAAEKYLSDPAMLKLDKDLPEYDLFELLKVKYTYNIISQSFANEGDSAIVKINLKSPSLVAIAEKADYALEADKQYAALKTEEEKTAYYYDVLIREASISSGEFVITTELDIGFTLIEGEWKIIADEALVNALLGKAQ